MKIALIGGGEVGQCYAKALNDVGHTVYLIIDKYPTAKLKDLSLDLNAEIRLIADELLQEADVVVCAAFGSATLEVAEMVAPFIKKDALYVDLTTGKPADILAASTIIQTQQAYFVDVAIAGAISIKKAKTALLIAGKRADLFNPIAEQLGAPLKIVSTEPGAAVSLKLLRSVFTKGFEALAVECFVAAEQKGLREELYEVLSDIDEIPITTLLETCVNTHLLHARRRLIEVEEAIDQLKDLGIEPNAIQGVEALFKKTVLGLDHTPYTEGDLKQNLSWLSQNLQTSKIKD